MLNFPMLNNYQSNAGNINIKAYDDGIHATSNVTLENGEISLGNVNISGGTIVITSKDDGIHADSTLTVNGGDITITSIWRIWRNSCWNKNEINGGNNNIYTTDDGVNAGSAIKVNGGVTVILVASGDTDAIDANGTYTQTGGVVVSMNMAAQGTATALDTDGRATISGGTFLAFGNLETTPTISNIKSTTKSASLNSGTYELKYNDEILVTFTLKTSYSKFYLAGASGTYNIGNNSYNL